MDTRVVDNCRWENRRPVIDSFVHIVGLTCIPSEKYMQYKMQPKKIEQRNLSGHYRYTRSNRHLYSTSKTSKFSTKLPPIEVKVLNSFL